MTKLKYGVNTVKVERFIEQIKNMTPEQVKAAGAAAYAADAADAAAAAAYAADAADASAAAYAAADAYADAAAYAAADAAYAAHYTFRWYFGRCAFALAIERLIGKHGFTQKHFDILTKPLALFVSVAKAETATVDKYSFDRKDFNLSTADIIALEDADIINVYEARYLIGFDK